MQLLTCIAIDDEPLALNLIEEYVSRMPGLKLIKSFDDAISGSEYIKSNPVDLLFVDINMPDITGIELVRSLAKKPMIIFTTAYKNFAYEGYELEAIDYLLKPIDFDRFNKAADKAIDYHQYKNAAKPEAEQGSIYVYSEYRMIRIDFSEIEYVESMEDYIKIHLQGHPKPVLTLMPLKKMLEKLPSDKFKRIHRSYIVALGKIRSIHNKKIQLKTIELPIGNSYSEVISGWSK